MGSLRVRESVYLNSTSPALVSSYSLADTNAYLARISHSTKVVTPSLELLNSLLLAHQLSVPYDSSALHVTRSDWNSRDQDKVIQLGEGDGMELFDASKGKGNFDRIVKRNTGGYCYSLNATFSALLRSLGFRVSEVGARVYLHRGKDPQDVGYLWSSITHEVLIVDWEGSERYLMDAGFGGGGCPYAILLKDGSTSDSLSANESFKLVEQVLRCDPNIYHDPAPGFMLLRRVLPPGITLSTASPADGYFTPCYHFNLTTTCISDIKMLNFYNETHPDAPFMKFFVVSRLLLSGARKTLAYGAPPTDMVYEEGDKRLAKLYTKNGILCEETDVSWHKFTIRSIKIVLVREFGFVFDKVDEDS